jgi:pimeloyl-ACP methyl ester carboxylesterase
MIPLRTGFATTEDGLHLYWRCAGDGPVIACCNGVGVSTFFWKYVVERFSPTNTVLVWDYRAHGRSDPLPDPTGGDVGIPRHARDLDVVLRHAGLERPLLVGHSMGVQVILEYHRFFPGQARGLVTMLGTAGRALDTFWGNPSSPRYFAIAARVIRRLDTRTHWLVRPVLESPLAWFVAQKAALVDPVYARRADMLPYMRHLAALDLRMFIRTVLGTNEHDAWDTLPGIDIPVLVIAAERDTFTPLPLSRRMAAEIPGAEFMLLADGSHAALIEQPETINHRIARFIADRHVFDGPGPAS